MIILVFHSNVFCINKVVINLKFTEVALLNYDLQKNIKLSVDLHQYLLLCYYFYIKNSLFFIPFLANCHTKIVTAGFWIINSFNPIAAMHILLVCFLISPQICTYTHNISTHLYLLRVLHFKQNVFKRFKTYYVFCKCCELYQALWYFPHQHPHNCDKNWNNIIQWFGTFWASSFDKASVVFRRELQFRLKIN